MGLIRHTVEALNQGFTQSFDFGAYYIILEKHSIGPDRIIFLKNEWVDVDPNSQSYLNQSKMLNYMGLTINAEIS